MRTGHRPPPPPGQPRAWSCQVQAQAQVPNSPSTAPCHHRHCQATTSLSFPPVTLQVLSAASVLCVPITAGHRQPPVPLLLSTDILAPQSGPLPSLPCAGPPPPYPPNGEHVSCQVPCITCPRLELSFCRRGGGPSSLCPCPAGVPLEAKGW